MLTGPASAISVREFARRCFGHRVRSRMEGPSPQRRTLVRHGRSCCCPETVINRGLAQTASYMDRCSADEGHWVIFDRERRLWKDKVFRRNEVADGTPIDVWGM